MLDSRGLRPKHRLGQNFLHDQNLIRKMVMRAAIKPGDLVLEVGPGTGALTEALWEAGAVVIAVEIDSGMAEIVLSRASLYADGRLPLLAVPTVFGASPVQIRAAALGFTLIRGDCLDGKHCLAPALLAAIAGRPFKLVANLPYGAATPLMILLATEHPNCLGQYVTIQREVADRLGARAKSEAYGSLSVAVALFARSELIAHAPPSCFWPAPEVTSSIVAIEPVQPRPTHDPRALAALLHQLFGQRRKQIGSILGRETKLPAGITPMMRAEELSPDQFAQLLALDG